MQPKASVGAKRRCPRCLHPYPYLPHHIADDFGCWCFPPGGRQNSSPGRESWDSSGPSHSASPNGTAELRPSTSAAPGGAGDQVKTRPIPRTHVLGYNSGALRARELQPKTSVGAKRRCPRCLHPYPYLPHHIADDFGCWCFPPGGRQNSSPGRESWDSSGPSHSASPNGTAELRPSTSAAPGGAGD